MERLVKKITFPVLVLGLVLMLAVPAFASDMTQLPQPVNLGHNIVNVCTPGAFGTMAEVNGHDYWFLPIKGQRMLVYDLDAWEKVDEVDTGIGITRGITVDSNGIVWLAGDVTHLVRYDPVTKVAQQTESYFKQIPAASAFAITEGDDGCLYFGTYKEGYLGKYDPAAKTFTNLGQPNADAVYASCVVMRNGYIYASLHGDRGGDGKKTHQIVKIDADTLQVVGRTDLTPKVNYRDLPYLPSIGFLRDDILVGCDSGTVNEMIAIDVNTMEFVDIGISAPAVRAVSEELDGKVYFTTKTDGLCAFDVATGKAHAIGGDLVNATTGLRAVNGNFVTLDREDLPGISIFTYGAMDTGVMCYNLQTQKAVLLDNIVAPNEGIGQVLRSLENGKAGSGEIYIGAYGTNKCVVYDTKTGAITKQYVSADMQTDCQYLYENVLYTGNYTLGALSRVDPDIGTTEILFSLNDDIFDQARIHIITGGENKIFAGTTPDQAKYGGFIAWYDLETKLTYVATGPDAEDVVYADTSDQEIAPVWYSALTGEKADIPAMFDQDLDQNDINDKFLGTVPEQTVQNLVYCDGLLYGTSSITGGSGSQDRKDLSAQLFVYDVAQMKMLAVCDVSDQIPDLKTPVSYIAGIAADPDYENNGKLWGIVSETLFSFCFDADSALFQIHEELSFNKETYWEGNSRQWFPRPILFHDGHIYAAFDKTGGFCKIDMEQPLQYTQLLTQNDGLPLHYVFGEDGNLYYDTGESSLYMLPLGLTMDAPADADGTPEEKTGFVFKPWHLAVGGVGIVLMTVLTVILLQRKKK